MSDGQPTAQAAYDEMRRRLRDRPSVIPEGFVPDPDACELSGDPRWPRWYHVVLWKIEQFCLLVGLGNE